MNSFLGLELWDWATLGLILLAMLVARFVARAVAGKILDRRDQMRGREMRPSLRREVTGAVGLVAAAAVGAIGLPFVPLAPRAALFADRALSALALVGGALFAIALLDVATATASARVAGTDGRAERLLFPVARKLGRAAIFVVACLVALGIFGVNVPGLIAGLGIGGLVIALAAKDSVENVFGSFTILFDMPFALGDWVKIGTVEGYVEQINLRSTRIRTADDSVVTLPNSNLIRASVENFGPRKHRRQRIVVPIGHPTPVENTERFLREMRAWLAAREDVDKERIVVEASEYAEGTLNLVVQTWILAPDAAQEAATRSGILLKIEELRASCELLKPGF